LRGEGVGVIMPLPRTSGETRVTDPSGVVVRFIEWVIPPSSENT
jgi:hypothetical protein